MTTAPCALAINREGSCRFAVCVGPWAIKIARNGTGRRCNLYEDSLWKTSTDARRNVLPQPDVAPVRLWADHATRDTVIRGKIGPLANHRLVSTLGLHAVR